MDDAKTWFFSLFIFAAFSAHAVDLEYIAPADQKKLEQQFDQASFNSKDTKALTDKKWSCNMYGMRSHMQVQRDLKLYSWSSASGVWHNAGAQLVSDYKAEHDSLFGTHERFEDQVKIMSDGQLISRLSVNSPQKMVVAYSICRALTVQP